MSLLYLEYAEYRVVGKGLASFAQVTPDGRISISLDLRNKLPDLPQDYANRVAEFAVDERDYDKPPKINIVIMIVGSRGALKSLNHSPGLIDDHLDFTGDVQPFLALGKRLREYGHRVRIATHETFRSFVKEAGLEFFSIGGDPKDLMSYMVKSNFLSRLVLPLLTSSNLTSDPGLIPGVDSLFNGDIGRKRKMIAEARPPFA